MIRLEANEPDSVRVVFEDERRLLDYCNQCPAPDRLNMHSPARVDLLVGLPNDTGPDHEQSTYRCDNGHRWTRVRPRARAPRSAPPSVPVSRQPTPVVHDEAFALQLIEDFRAMQESTEAMMLAVMLRNEEAFRPVVEALYGVRMPAQMRRDHSAILSALVHLQETGRSITVDSCIHYLAAVDDLETAGGRAGVLSLSALAGHVPTSALELAREVTKLSRARVNTGQEVWTEVLYRWFDAEDRLLYIGITNNLAARTASHDRKSSWAAFATHKIVEYYPDRQSVEAMERWAIEAERPLFNHVHNDTPEARQRLVDYLIAKGRTDLLAPAVSRG